MLRCVAEVHARIRSFVGYDQHLSFTPNDRWIEQTHVRIEQTHAPCSQVCSTLSRCYHTVQIRVANDEVEDPIDYSDGVETLRVLFLSAETEDVVRAFMDAMYMLPEIQTPLRLLYVRFPRICIGCTNLLDGNPCAAIDAIQCWLSHYVEHCGEYHTRIRVFFPEGVTTYFHTIGMVAPTCLHILTCPETIARMINEILQDYSVDICIDYRGHVMGAEEILYFLGLQ